MIKETITVEGMAIILERKNIKNMYLRVIPPEGNVKISAPYFVSDDENGKIWCHKIFFTYNIAWDGEVILCCNDYNRRTVNLGNAFCNNIDVETIKKDILFNNKIPELCKKCRRWKDVEYENILKEYNIK